MLLTLRSDVKLPVFGACFDFQTSGIPVEDLLKHLFILRDNDATQHLFRVSAGLDSLDPTKGFLRIFLQNSPYLEKKKLEVARFRQCVSLGRQN
jgi:hypothetical protein